MASNLGAYQDKVRNSYDALNSEVVAAGGVLTTDMRDLRDRVSAGKLGRYVVESIQDELTQRGLGHSSLSLGQWDEVRVWKKGTRVASVIEAALAPGKIQDEVLRELSDNQADDILKQVRSLVCG